MFQRGVFGLTVFFCGIWRCFSGVESSEVRENQISEFGFLFSNDIINNNLPKKLPKIYWNIPTFQCDNHKLNFSKLAEKYNISQNENDRFRGDEIAILYDPGSFPAILKDGPKTVLRNGGVPQKGNLTYHLELFAEIVEQLIPNENFSGVGVIDFESWRPVFRQNFGTLEPYKTISVDIEKKNHPSWSRAQIEKLAAEKFESHAKQFMNETLTLAKQLRPGGQWGYYHYPYCFNMSPNNMRKECPKEVQAENDRITWLFSTSDTMHPSLYLSERLNLSEKVQMIEGRIGEAQRMANNLDNSPEIIPYFWYKYLDNQTKFVTKGDLFKSFTVLAESDIDGLVLWGSSNDVNTKSKCLALFQYVDDVLGPSIINSFYQ